MAEVIQVDDAVALHLQMSGGELPKGWADTLGGADPDLVLITMWTARLSRVVASRYASLLRDHDLQYSDFAALTLVCLIGPTSPTSIQDYLVITSGGVTKTIDRLAARGLVKRSTDPDDGRGVVVHVTPAGAKLQAHLFAADIERQETDLDAMTESERRQLLVSLRRLLDMLEPE